MSKERAILRRLAEGDNRGDFFISNELLKEIEAILAQPEQEEREVSGKIISTDDACNWNLTVGALKDYDHVYVNDIRYVEFQPAPITFKDDADKIAHLENSVELLSSLLDASKREPLGKEIKVPCGTTEYMFGFKDGVLYAEKAHGIGGGE